MFKKKSQYISAFFLIIPLLFGTNPSCLYAQSKDTVHDSKFIQTLIHAADSLQYSNQDSALNLIEHILRSIDQDGDHMSIYALYLRGTTFYHAGNTDTALLVLKDVLNKSMKYSDTIFEVRSLNSIGLVYLKKGKYSKAIEFIKKSGERANYYKILDREAATFNNLGLIYRDLGMYDKSLESLKKAYRIYTELKDTFAQVTVQNNTGLVYKDLNDHEGAMKYYIKALKLANELQNIDLKSMLYINIGVLYNVQKDYEKALYYFNKSLKLKKLLNFTYDLAIIYSDMGEVHLNLGNKQNAEKYYLKSLHIYDEVGSLKDKINVRCNISNVYLKTGKHLESMKMLNEIDSLFQSADHISLKLRIRINSTKYQYYETVKDFENAFIYSKKYMEYKDSLQKSVLEDRIAKQKILYELDYKEQELEKLKAEKKLNKLLSNEQDRKITRNKYILLVVILIVLIGFVLLYLLFRQVRINKRINNNLNLNRKELLEKNYEITQQNEEIKAQTDQLVEVNEDLMLLNSAVNETDNAVVILNKEGYFQWANKGFDKLYEIPFKEFKKIYPNVLDTLNTHSNAEEIRKVIVDCIENQISGSFEFSDRNKFGDQIWIHTNIKSVTDEYGNVQSIIIIDTDITDKVKNRKMLEIKNYELKKQQNEIKNQSLQLHTINRDLLQFKAAVNKTDNAIMILDPKGYFTWGNKGFENLYGISFREYSKKYPNILDAHETSVNRKNVLNVIKSCIYNKTPGNFEFTIFRGDEKIWIQSSIKAVTNKKDEVQSLIIIDTDISEKVKTTRLMEIKNYELERQREEIDASLRYAQNIQKAILPAPLNMRKNNDFFLIYLPKDIVSGDFYWFSDKKDSPFTYFAVVDCTGHGVPGAFMSMIGARILNTIVNEKNIIMPSQILEEMHNSVKIALRQKLSGNRDGMDVSLVRIEKEANSVKEIVFSGAMQSIFYYQNKEEKLHKLRGDVKSIGGHYYDEVNFTDKIIQLSKNDIIYLFSDGYIDQDSPDGKKIGSAMLSKILKKIAATTLSEQKESLMKYLKEHKKDENQRDDITFLGIKIR